MVVASKDQEVVVESDFEKRIGITPSDVGDGIKRGHSQAVGALCMRIAAKWPEGQEG